MVVMSKSVVVVVMSKSVVMMVMSPHAGQGQSCADPQPCADSKANARPVHSWRSLVNIGRGRWRRRHRVRVDDVSYIGGLGRRGGWLGVVVGLRVGVGRGRGRIP